MKQICHNRSSIGCYRCINDITSHLFGHCQDDEKSQREEREQLRKEREDERVRGCQQLADAEAKSLVCADKIFFPGRSMPLLCKLT